MAIEVTISGNGKFGGHSTNLFSYTSNEESTPIDPDDSSGGYGQLQFDAVEDDDAEGSVLLINDNVQLTDGSNGITGGVVTDVASQDGIVTVTSDSRIGILRARVQALPFSGTLENAFAYYLSLAGVTGGYVVDAAIANRPVAFPGWTDEVYSALKRMCAALEIEMSLVSNNIVLRPIRMRIAQNLHDTAESWKVSSGQLAQNIEIYYYNNEVKANYLAYPISIYDDVSSIGPIASGQTMVMTVELSASLQSVNQPTAQTSLAADYTGPNSVYTVLGKDNQIVDPLWWAARGGAISVVLEEDTRTLTITVVGATDADSDIAPYRIAQLGDDEEPINSLKITGSGVFFTKELLTLPTGAELSRTARELGATVDNEFITSMTDAYTAGLKTAQKYAAAEQSVTISATVVNRANEAGDIRYPTFDDFASANAGQTFNTFNTTWSGKTFQDFTLYYLAQVGDKFENQAFGNAAGARVLFRNAWYRVRSATITPGNIDYTAERDTIINDFNTVWSGKTFDDFNAHWAGKTFEDMAVIPLWA